MTLQKWQLLTKTDISPSPYFPLERRHYRLPNGREVDDFFVATLADPVHVLPVTKDQKVVMIRMYKQGANEIMLQFPAGRFESKKHKSFEMAAAMELEEETGIKVSTTRLKPLGQFIEESTKSTAQVHAFFVDQVEFNSTQKCDENEEIEIILLSPDEVDKYILEGRIWDTSAISVWYLAKLKQLV